MEENKVQKCKPKVNDTIRVDYGLGIFIELCTEQIWETMQTKGVQSVTHQNVTLLLYREEFKEYFEMIE